jgi:hypothetical protein
MYLMPAITDITRARIIRVDTCSPEIQICFELHSCHHSVHVVYFDVPCLEWESWKIKEEAFDMIENVTVGITAEYHYWVATDSFSDCQTKRRCSFQWLLNLFVLLFFHKIVISKTDRFWIFNL